MIKKLYGIIIVFLSIKAFGAFEVAPPVQTIDLQRSRAAESMVINSSDKLVRVQIYPKKPENMVNDEFYIGDEMIIYPKLLYIKPRSKRPVRFGLRVPKELADGEYRTAIVYEELDNETIDDKELEGEAGVGLEIFSVVVGALYANKGDILYSLKIESVYFELTEEEWLIKGSLKNTGTGSIRPLMKVTYYNSKGKKIGDATEIARKVIRENTLLLSEPIREIPKNTKSALVEIFRMKDEFDTSTEEKLGEIKVKI